LRMFQQLNAEGLTVLLVTHDPKVAAYAHRVIRMQAMGRRRLAGSKRNTTPPANCPSRRGRPGGLPARWVRSTTARSPSRKAGACRH
jgi:energy-coupling factor transporter ATP-binding protein EcfA2